MFCRPRQARERRVICLHHGLEKTRAGRLLASQSGGILNPIAAVRVLMAQLSRHATDTGKGLGQHRVPARALNAFRACRDQQIHDLRRSGPRLCGKIGRPPNTLKECLDFTVPTQADMWNAEISACRRWPRMTLFLAIMSISSSGRRGRSARTSRSVDRALRISLSSRICSANAWSSCAPLQNSWTSQSCAISNWMTRR